jgi:hypothetical protein
MEKDSDTRSFIGWNGSNLSIYLWRDPILAVMGSLPSPSAVERRLGSKPVPMLLPYGGDTVPHHGVKAQIFETWEGRESSARTTVEERRFSAASAVTKIAGL